MRVWAPCSSHVSDPTRRTPEQPQAGQLTELLSLLSVHWSVHGLKWHIPYLRCQMLTIRLAAFLNKTFSYWLFCSAQNKPKSFHTRGPFPFILYPRKTFLHLCTFTFLILLRLLAASDTWKAVWAHSALLQRCHLSPLFTDLHYKALVHCRLLRVHELLHGQ